MAKPVYRQSMIKEYRKCPKCCERRYVKGFVQPPNYKMTMGSSLDAVLNEALERKIKGEPLMSLGEASDLAAEEMSRRRIETAWEGEDFNLCRDHTIKAASQVIANVVPKIDPLYTQLDVLVETNLPFNISSTIDVLDKAHRVRDLKFTTARGKQFYQVNDDIQSACYTIAVEALTGIRPKSFVFDLVVRSEAKSGGITYSPVEGTVTEEDIFDFWEAAQDLHNSMVSGVFPRTDSHLCECRKYRQKIAQQIVLKNNLANPDKET